MPSEIEHTGKNKSEMLFEGYLRSYGYAHPDFEPTIEGTPRRPDYRLVWNGHELLFEVKEFRGTAKAFASKGGSFGSFDPYPPVRKKIEAARNKFRDLGSHCCCLVLYNRDKPLVLLDWQHMYGARSRASTKVCTSRKAPM